MKDTNIFTIQKKTDVTTCGMVQIAMVDSVLFNNAGKISIGLFAYKSKKQKKRNFTVNVTINKVRVKRTIRLP